MKIRTRFAPSPTGFLHIGSLRTALYNFLFAKKHKGTFVLRIEDTDRERYVEGAVQSLLATLETVHLSPDEGPVLSRGKMAVKGKYGPYVQSERLELYQKYVEELVKNGHAYYCFCSKERLQELRKGQEASKQPTKYDRHCFTLSADEIAQKHSVKEPHVIRLRIPEGETSFEDTIRGRITFPNAEMDDQVLLKSDGFPTYHLAVVVDDHLMNISHIIRGEEWLSSTPKHVILYQAFGWEMPTFAHLPLILNPDRSKLSKRHGDVAVVDYLAKGYLPEALVNFVALLGWNPKADQELYSLDELVSFFELSKVNKAGAVLNTEKLDWMNGQYIRRMSPKQLTEACAPYLAKAGVEIEKKNLEKICEVERERLTILSEIVERVQGYLHLPEYAPTLLVWKKADAADAKQNLQGLIAFFAKESSKIFAKIPLLEEALSRYTKERQLQNGNVFWPLRVALSGRAASPSPFELAWVLGREETINRLHMAVKLLGE